jgi:hypothetical protein
MTDLGEYSSSFTICKEQDLEQSNATLEGGIEEGLRQQEQFNNELQNGQVQDSGKGSKTQDRLKAMLEEKRRRDSLQNSWLDGATSVIASPGKVFNWIFLGWFPNAVTDTAKMLVLISLFVVNEIILTLTLFKDFSLLIGGEPRLLGVTKLV